MGWNRFTPIQWFGRLHSMCKVVGFIAYVKDVWCDDSLSWEFMERTGDWSKKVQVKCRSHFDSRLKSKVWYKVYLLQHMFIRLRYMLKYNPGSTFAIIRILQFVLLCLIIGLIHRINPILKDTFISYINAVRRIRLTCNINQKKFQDETVKYEMWYATHVMIRIITFEWKRKPNTIFLCRDILLDFANYKIEGP